MARYFDSPIEQGWLHELARAETHPDAEQLLQLGKAFDPQQLVEESTIKFLTELRECFVEYAKIFNSFSEGGARFLDVKIYSLAQTPADFMVFRNGVKLIVANTAHGVVQISFSKHTRSQLAVDGQTGSVAPAAEETVMAAGGAGPSGGASGQEIVAQMGPFREVLWTFQGEKISSEQITRFYFGEFVRATRDTKRSRSSNELLLKQIKTLLQEKGLDF